MEVPFLQRQTINTKVVLAYLAFVLVVGTAGVLLVLHNEKAVILEGHIRLARNLSENAQPVLLVEHKMMLNRLVQTVGKLPDVRSCAIVNQRGVVVAHTDAAMIGRLLRVSRAVREAYAGKGYYLETFDQGLENVYVPVVSDGRALGTVFVSFERTGLRRLFQEPRETTVRSLLIVILFTALVGLVGAFVIARLISYPIRVLTKKVYDVHQGRLPEPTMPGNYVYCWEELNCRQTACPSYENREQKCWAVAGTFCRGEVQGVFAQKIGDCRKCIVFRKNSGDELMQLNDAFDIMVRDLADSLERSRAAKEDVEAYARELETAGRENLDLKAYTERILNSLSSAVISLDEDLVIRKFNRSAQSLLGVDLEALVGRDIREVAGLCTRCNDFFGFILEDLEEYGRSARPIVGHEVSVTRADGEGMTIRLSVLPLHGGPPGGKTPMIVAFEDITEKERMREELHLSRQLAELGEVAAKVAHDIRNPLNAIAGGIHYLTGKYEADAEIQDVANLINGQVDRLNKVTSELLNASKTMTLHLHPCDLNRLSDETAVFLEEAVETAGLKMEKDYASDLPPLFLDPYQIQRAMINLLENAIDAMPEGGTMTIRTRRLDATEGGEGRVEFAVLDRGAGIPEDIQEKIFKPFFSTKAHGTGLGLSIVRQIVRQHRGEVRVRPREPGPGTEVSVSFPMEAEPAESDHGRTGTRARH